jgi:hypothetical protein
MLYKYLTDQNVPITNNFTKNTLVDQTLAYWRNTENGVRAYSQNQQSSEMHKISKNLHNHHHQQQQQQHQQFHPHTYQQVSKPENHVAEHFPINVMSRNFCSWFYANFNECKIQTNDFWSDCTCIIRMIDSSGDIKEDSTITSSLVLNLLYTIKGQFNFYFNPNLSHEGTRGKMELHGLVLILCCGTLHTHESVVVGVFESVFGLMRDPFSDNNWKIKNIKLQLQSSIGAQKIPELQQCSSLQQFLALPEIEETL